MSTDVLPDDLLAEDLSSDGGQACAGTVPSGAVPSGAVPSVALTAAGLVVDGEPQVLLCASLFPFRLPREEWAARLAQVRASGYRAVDVYVPWNFHELAPGRWDFSGRRDVGAFLDLAADAGLAVVARPGPYICSEWDGGALPAWLTLEDGLRPRQAEPRFLAHVRRWFEQVLPLLAARQHGRGGSVVAVQLENELDFFDTDDRAAYVGALRDLAREHGVVVPLVACAGQGDLVGATGDVEGVVPAFNFYPSDRSPAVEAEVRAYADLVAERGLPLLVTETNRDHRTLRRLLVSGARLVAPYLQASGYDFGWMPSVGNWGDPGGLMTHDYDFGGYVSPVGELRPGHAAARVLAAVVEAYGPALAAATTHPSDLPVVVDGPTASSPSALHLVGGGSLVGLPNLSDDEVVAHVGPVAGLPVAAVRLPAASCPLVTVGRPLDAHGLPGTLLLATADVVALGPDGVVLASAVPAVVGLGTSAVRAGDERPAVEGARVLGTSDAAGSGVLVELPAGERGVRHEARVTVGATTWPLVVVHPDDVGPGGVAETGTAVPGAGVVDVGRQDVDAEPRRLTAARRLVPPPPPAPVRHTRAPRSEEVGVHRGRLHLRTRLVRDGADALLLEGAGDLVDLSLDGRALPTLARFGATAVVDLRGEADAVDLAATVETWGHPNFDDARLPGLRLGSLRGLGDVWRVVGRTDVSALWTVHGDAQWAGDPAPLRTLGGWSSTRVGREVVYRRALPVAPDANHALRLDGVPGAVVVRVDGHERVVHAVDPWLHLAPGEGATVEVVLPHTPGALGGAELLRLAPVEGWDVVPEDDEAIVAAVRAAVPAAPPEGPGADVFPVRPGPGEEVWLELAVPTGTGWSIRPEGEQVRLTVVAGDEGLGRVWLDDAARPRLTGGDGGRIWLPAAWNTGTVRLMVRGTAGGPSPVLHALVASPVPPPSGP
ncbi:beta-galactosidase [Cellulomonas marina]|uniref:Glycosyl hydrolases family 35 n=1 Tax=Cellulomonas marina TaxID=988821 RepID=A0A1I1A9Y3_9CELL|nr:beta-galactosidase [Cellulomonas marina]GIG30399.1 hypothetical protein Cma02nite_29990 [Cellulomonas marina]SFB34789.1 Glycosyl hydrolases family 35 [Cellulomonas marina]